LLLVHPAFFGLAPILGTPTPGTAPTIQAGTPINSGTAVNRATPISLTSLGLARRLRDIV